MNKTRAQAKIGGEVGFNSFFYKGGQFLPSTKAEPGKWKIGKKWIHSKRELIAPGETALQPTPFSRSLFALAGVGYFSVLDANGKLALNLGSNGQGVRDPQGETINLETKIRPGVNGVLGEEELTLCEILDAWNNGGRWFDVKPMAQTIQTDIQEEPEITCEPRF